MALLHGKQIRPGSIDLGRLSGSGQVTFATASMNFTSGSVLRTDDGNIQTGTDVVNKNYVDAIAQGLTIRESVRVLADANVSLATAPSTIDGYNLQANDRVLLVGQTNTAENGIYVFNGTNLVLADDFQEVKGGIFTFVTDGGTYDDTGWVVATPNDGPHNMPHANTWTQFSSTSVANPKRGLTSTGNDWEIDYENANQSVQFGFDGTDKLIADVNLGNGLDKTLAGEVYIKDIDTDTIDLTVDGTGIRADLKYENSNSVTLSESASGLKADVNLENIVGSGITVSNGKLELDFDETTYTAEKGIILNGTTFSVDYDNSGNNVILDTTSGKLEANVDLEGIAGAGLTVSGGKLTQDVTMSGTGSHVKSVTQTSDGLVITYSDSDDDTLYYAGDGLMLNGNTFSISTDDTNSVKLSIDGSDKLIADVLVDATKGLTVSSNGLEVKLDSNVLEFNPNGEITFTSGANGLTDVGDGLTANNGIVSIEPSLAGDGLVYSNGVLDLDISNTDTVDLSFNSNKLEADVNLVTKGGLTSSNNGIEVEVDGSTIQIVDGKLTAVGGVATPIFESVSPNGTIGDHANTGITIAQTPNKYSRIEIYVNGKKEQLGNGDKNYPFYFDTTGKVWSAIEAGDILYWNGIIAGYDLDLTDIVEIVYEV